MRVKREEQVLKAADAAARWHVHQRRKGPAEEPYINHLIEVAMLVAEATDGADTNLVIAAPLHDAIEDCEVPKELILETFGDEVRSREAPLAACFSCDDPTNAKTGVTVTPSTYPPSRRATA